MSSTKTTLNVMMVAIAAGMFDDSCDDDEPRTKRQRLQAGARDQDTLQEMIQLQKDRMQKLEEMYERHDKAQRQSHIKSERKWIASQKSRFKRDTKRHELATMKIDLLEALHAAGKNTRKIREYQSLVNKMDVEMQGWSDEARVIECAETDALVKKAGDPKTLVALGKTVQECNDHRQFGSESQALVVKINRKH